MTDLYNTGVLTGTPGPVNLLLRQDEPDPTTVEGRMEVPDRYGVTPQPEDMTEGAHNDSDIRALYFDSITPETAFWRFINWLTRHSVTGVRTEGDPLGESIIFDRDPAAGDPMAASRVVNLEQAEGQEELYNYLINNWQKIPDLVDRVGRVLEDRVGQYQLASSQAGLPTGVPAAQPANFTGRGTEQIPQVSYEELLGQFGDREFNGVTLMDLDNQYGPGAAADALYQVLERSVLEHVEEIAATNSTMLIGPEAPVFDPLGAAQAPGGQVAFITSFDGTPFGEIHSVNDLFSGGQIGPWNARPFLLDFYEATKDARGYSINLEQVQQELFAWGYMEEPAEWGKLDPVMRGPDATLDALHTFQADLVNNALQIYEEVPEGGSTVTAGKSLIAPDGTPYVGAVVSRMIGAGLSVDDSKAATVRQQEQRAIAQVQERIKTRIASSGRQVTEAGLASIASEIDQMIQGSRSEIFGQGGTARERQLAESILSQFYANPTGDWASDITFGATDSDMDYINYARRVGALSDEEMEMLTTDLIYQTGQSSSRSVRGLGTELKKDVAVANLLKFITSGMEGGLESVTADDIRRGLVTYAHTMGQRTAGTRGLTDRDFADMAQRAYGNVQGVAPLEQTAFVGTLEQRISDAMGLSGGSGPYQQVLQALGPQRGTPSIRPRNV